MTHRWLVRAYYADTVQAPKVPGALALEVGGATEDALAMDVAVLRARKDIGEVVGPFPGERR